MTRIIITTLSIAWRPKTQGEEEFILGVVNKKGSGKKVLKVKVAQNDPLDLSGQKN